MKFIKRRKKYLESILENKQQAEKILKNRNIELDHPQYKELKMAINSLFKKPTYLGLMTKFLFEDEVSLDEIKDLLRWLKESNQPNNRLPKNPLEYDSFEEIKDDIIKVDNDNKVNKFYQELNSSQKQLYKKASESEKEEFYNWALKAFDYKNINTLTTKISASHTMTEIIEALKNFVMRNEGDNTYSSKINEIENTDGAKLVYTDDDTGLIVARIDTYDASKKLGSSAWCISNGASTFHNYVTNHDRTQYFIWDYSKDIVDPLFMTGVTLSPSKKITHAHDMMDKSVKNNLPESMEKILMDIEGISYEELIERRRIAFLERYDEDFKTYVRYMNDPESWNKYAYDGFKKLLGIKEEDTEEIKKYLKTTSEYYINSQIEEIEKDLDGRHIWYDSVSTKMQKIKNAIIYARDNNIDIEYSDDIISDLNNRIYDSYKGDIIETYEDLDYKPYYKSLLKKLYDFNSKYDNELSDMYIEVSNMYNNYIREMYNDEEIAEKADALAVFIGEEDFDKYEYEPSNSDYGHMTSFESKTHNTSYNVGTKDEADRALEVYAESYYDNIGIEGMQNIEDYIDTKQVIEDHVDDDEYYFRELGEEDYRDKDLEDIIDRIKDEDEDMDDRHSAFQDIEDYDYAYTYLSDIDYDYDESDVIRLIDEDGDELEPPFILNDNFEEEYIEKYIENEKESRTEEIESDPAGYLKMMFGEIDKRYIDDEKVIQAIIDDGYSIMTSYGIYNEIEINGTDYIVFRTN